ncbi:MAG: hypothetical protein QOE31_3868 [Solirubrobacteraceae bacterium]|nr:hypothetical protein [Solirubrobacteraceae bacterium]
MLDAKLSWNPRNRVGVSRLAHPPRGRSCEHTVSADGGMCRLYAQFVWPQTAVTVCGTLVAGVAVVEVDELGLLNRT